MTNLWILVHNPVVHVHMLYFGNIWCGFITCEDAEYFGLNKWFDLIMDSAKN